jgi:hypothetical protein
MDELLAALKSLKYENTRETDGLNKKSFLNMPPKS